MAALQTTHRAAVAVGGYERPDPPLIYSLDLGGLEDSVRALWRGLEKDTETDEFLETCQANTIKDSFASLLRNFMSRTDANGLAGRGKMFVISKAQLAFLCPQVFAADRNGPRRLLDIGSGDGSITERYAGDFDEVVTTETSSVMAGKLRSRGWACYEPGKQDLPLPASDTEKFDFITCLNVLDRADKPLTLLRELKAQLKPGTGRLLLAVVLPWCPFVESGTKQLPPSEQLPMEGARCRDKATFEKSLDALVQRVLIPEGFNILSISRVPYISQGDSYQRYYTLSDAIIVCEVPLQQPQL